MPAGLYVIPPDPPCNPEGRSHSVTDGESKGRTARQLEPERSQGCLFGREQGRSARPPSTAHLPAAAPAAVAGAPTLGWTGSHGCRGAGRGTSTAKTPQTCSHRQSPVFYPAAPCTPGGGGGQRPTEHCSCRPSPANSRLPVPRDGTRSRPRSLKLSRLTFGAGSVMGRFWVL